MRASRLLTLLLLLQNRGRMTAEALAAELAVSVRTVYRDVESLIAAGVPVYGEAGRAGGYQLVEGYRTRLTGLSADESRSLVLTGLPGAAADLGLATALVAARLKLQAASPHREQGQAFHQRIHIDAPSWHSEAEAVPHLTAVLQAALDQQRIRVHYRNWQQAEPAERMLEPYGLVLKAGRWYAVARRTDAQFRTYRVGKITQMDVDGTFQRVPFDLAEHWQQYTADYDARRFTGTAVLRLSPAGLRRLPELLGAAMVALAEARPESGPGGWSRTTLPIESVENALAELLRLGPEVEVIAPPELRDRMAASARALHQLYSGQQ
jgi:predicted DNA-binding transcriptional regulator YafY